MKSDFSKWYSRTFTQNCADIATLKTTLAKLIWVKIRFCCTTQISRKNALAKLMEMSKTVVCWTLNQLVESVVPTLLEEHNFIFKELHLLKISLSTGIGSGRIQLNCNAWLSTTRIMQLIILNPINCQQKNQIQSINSYCIFDSWFNSNMAAINLCHVNPKELIANQEYITFFSCVANNQQCIVSSH